MRPVDGSCRWRGCDELSGVLNFGLLSLEVGKRSVASFVFSRRLLIGSRSVPDLWKQLGVKFSRMYEEAQHEKEHTMR